MKPGPTISALSSVSVLASHAIGLPGVGFLNDARAWMNLQIIPTTLDWVFRPEILPGHRRLLVYEDYIGLVHCGGVQVKAFSSIARTFPSAHRDR